VLAVAALAAVPLALGAGGGHAHRAGRPAGLRHCAPAGTRLLAGNGVVRVYSWSSSTGPPGPTEACVVRTGARMTLESGPSRRFPGLHRSVGDFELAGSIVGYIETQFGVDSGTTQLVVADVASRRILRSIKGGQYIDAGIISSQGVRRFVLTPRGAVAWVTTTSRSRRLQGVTVYAAPPAGRAVVLDEGLAIDPASLRLSGSTLSWTDGGATRTARMP
jgi:hypothetical protein